MHIHISLSLSLSLYIYIYIFIYSFTYIFTYYLSIMFYYICLFSKGSRRESCASRASNSKRPPPAAVPKRGTRDSRREPCENRQI